MNGTLRQYLTERKYSIPSDQTYSHIDEWLDWYEGDVPNFHTYKVYNGMTMTSHIRYRLNMAKTVCEDWANLLLNEKVSIKAGQYEKRLNEILEKNNFRVQGNQLIELSFALGTGAIVEYLDESGQVLLDFIRADMIYPLSWDNGDITECAFGSTKVEDGKELIYLQIHRKGIAEPQEGEALEEPDLYYIENHYVDAESGKEVELPEGMIPVISTGSSVPMFQIMTPNVCNNVDLDSPLGISVYANGISQLKGCDLVYDSYMNEYVLGRKRILVPISMAKKQMEKDGVTAPYFDPNDTVYYLMPGDSREASKPEQVDMSIRAQEHELGIQRSLDLLSLKCGMGTGRYKFESGGVKTATEVISDKSDLYQNRQKHVIVVNTALAAMAKSIAFLDQGLTDLTVEVSFDDSIIEDTNTTIDRNIKLVQAGLRSKLTAIMEINKCDENEAKKELERIAQEGQIQAGAIDWGGAEDEPEPEDDQEDPEEKEDPAEVDDQEGAGSADPSDKAVNE